MNLLVPHRSDNIYNSASSGVKIKCNCSAQREEQYAHYPAKGNPKPERQSVMSLSAQQYDNKNRLTSDNPCMQSFGGHHHTPHAPPMRKKMTSYSLSRALNAPLAMQCQLTHIITMSKAHVREAHDSIFLFQNNWLVKSQEDCTYTIHNAPLNRHFTFQRYSRMDHLSCSKKQIILVNKTHLPGHVPRLVILD